MPHVTPKLPTHHDPKAMVAQSYLFDLRWQRDEVEAWLRAHGRNATLDLVGKHWRARQADPDLFKRDSFRTIKIADGIEIVVGKLK